MSDEQIKKEVFLVEGMTCAGCERAVQKILGNLNGVKAAKADLQSATVLLEFDPSKLTLDEIKAATNKIGYKIVGERAPEGKKEGRDDAIS
jgi:copper chaperone CopZ